METIDRDPNSTANGAVYQRYRDLPYSKMVEFNNYLMEKGQYNHFHRSVCLPGWNLQGTKAITVLALKSYLGISLEEICNNSVKPSTFAEFSQISLTA